MARQTKESDGTVNPTESVAEIDPSEAAKALGRLGGLKGGRARAEKLSPDERSAIARKGAKKRWENARADEPPKVPMATHMGVLRIGDTELPCAVLEDGTRVFNQGEFLNALGRSKSPAGRRKGDDEQLPAFLAARNLKPFISEDLRSASRPILFRPKTSGQGGDKETLTPLAHGYRVELLPQVCKTYLEARDAGVLMPGEQHGQKRIAARCDILIRGLATVGIIALVDEATGFQYDRARKALSEILERFIAKELVHYSPMFSDDFYREMFRLRGWQFNEGTTKRPIHAAKLTIDLVYARLAPGVFEQLKRLTPRDEKGRLKHKLFQRLTENFGHPRLLEHLNAVTHLMMAFDDWRDFYRGLQRSFPKYNENLLLDLKFSSDEPGESES